MRNLITAALFLSGTMSAVPVSAACIYQGVYYEHGSTLCFDGWYQECTVADYWSAIGICRAPDVMQPVAQQHLSDQQEVIAMLLGITHKPKLSKNEGE